ncbi:outer membrane protein assembly factor BamA [Phaeodactylibacter luteus]|uniref:Outer membrane protein assembly factor BamA n=1 Tax=Phaeodactylibacter luteus TaxID=1564516 RepID=A0A5C6RHY2_9BACT|nr:outer membrane protein assembly factor BamA [Phaeodactylibacter luteus]TXB61787.1 outer membrane protein assembly factor BamA [Phaeodactylibacter luteus]
MKRLRYQLPYSQSYTVQLQLPQSFLLALALMMAPLAAAFAQTANDSIPVLEYGEPLEFEIGGVKVVGADFSDDNAIISIAGFRVGDKIRIPGPDVQKAIKALWKLRLFTDVQVVKEKTIGDIVFLEIHVQERPRLTRHSYRGVKKSVHDDLNDEVNKYLLKGGIVTENVKVNAREAIEEYFIGKGFLDARATVTEITDSIRANSVRLVFDIDRGDKVKIRNIEFVGNNNVKGKKLRKKMEDTKEKRRLFASSKFIKAEYEEDKDAIIAFYNTLGYRDAQIVKDSLWRDADGLLNTRITIDEGNQYYFRNISWKGNSIYDEQTLASVLSIEKGDIYNQELLQTRLSFSQDGRDVSTLYMDNGYLFFQVDPIEVSVENDSIDLEIRIFEGPQATIDKVVIEGNDRTHEHVIRRQIRTKPGQKFSRSDIIRSQRELMNLNYFNPETLGINTPVNPQRGTVDIEYTVEEKPSDQLELSAGWGGIQGVIGTLGVSFNNFSLRNIFNKESWKPLPQGDGQRLSLRAQTNGDFFQSYNASFTEPWLGGKKPNSLTVAGFFNRFAFGARGTESYRSLSIKQATVSLGSRLKWPDDNFVASTSLNIQTLSLDDWAQNFSTDQGERVDNGNFNNFSITQTIVRSTVNDPIFPKDGARVSLSVQLTPPYSLFNPDRDYASETVSERFRFVEYHKWRLDVDWYTPIVGDLIFKAQAKIGLIGFYDSRIGTSPFERFQLGGDGINNQQFGFAGVNIISLRGYEVTDLPANIGPNGQQLATPVYNKYTVELRYPISLNPSSTIYVLAFAQGGNAWQSTKEFNPFDLRRSAGMGLRVFLPMFGTLGFDYGIGFDKPGAERSLKGLGDFNIILGFEPE